MRNYKEKDIKKSVCRYMGKNIKRHEINVIKYIRNV